MSFDHYSSSPFIFGGHTNFTNNSLTVGAGAIYSESVSSFCLKTA